MPLISIFYTLSLLCGLLVLAPSADAEAGPQSQTTAADIRNYAANGVVKEVNPADRQVVIAHDAITNYMDAMTMPFKVRNLDELAGLRAGDQVSFRLRVTETESWIEQIAKAGTVAAPASAPPPGGAQPVRFAPTVGNPGAGPAGTTPRVAESASGRPRHPLMDFPFTNELGQRVTLGEFHGQALAITFFFTRCPIPDYCPRLTRNFQEASRKLSALPHGPTNWHFLSVSFDAEFDTPAVLRAYAEHYHYNPEHWSFLTGPADKIHELASLSNVTFDKENGFFNHNFRTLVIDATGHLQMTFPVGGDLSDALVSEILKATASTNQPP